MNDNDLKKVLKSAFDAAQPADGPTFDETLANAAGRLRRRRMQMRLGIAAAAVVALAVGMLLWTTPQSSVSQLPSDDLLIADALMNSTSWQAPSDALLPTHTFDLYQDIPFGDVSTDLEEGSLL